MIEFPANFLISSPDPCPNWFIQYFSVIVLISSLDSLNFLISSPDPFWIGSRIEWSIYRFKNFSVKFGNIRSICIMCSSGVKFSKGPIFEDGPGFESAFNLFHGRDGIVPLSRKSHVPHENCNEIIDDKPEPALPFNPLAGRAASISLSAFGPFGFNFFNGKDKKQNKKPNNLDQSHKKPQNPDQNSMKKGGNPPSQEALSNDWLENGQCPLARYYRAMGGVLPIVAKALQPPAGMKLKCPPAIVAARAAFARTALVKL